MSRISAARKLQIQHEPYASFDKLNGSHPWQKLLPNACVLYRARVLPHGRVLYFNYALAKEMGLIEKDHPHSLNPDLERQLVQTFSLQIINEYDELTQKRIDPATIKPNRFMATRYLQLQHSNKKGKTSGDGRGIWNGTVRHKGLVWDVSSRGTGVTCLAPGSVQANRPLKTGTTNFGYGCGQADIDELYGAALLAETIHLQGIHTERVLCIIDLGRGVGIGVRAAPNLLRPAHLFLLLKQNRYAELKTATHYFIQRQLQNKTWSHSGSNSYEFMLRRLSNDFANFAAKLEMDYIFAWLDWDGDNVLASAGIIDYGSVRQFGIRHDSYRYDDVERFSTNLNEQKSKAREIVQVFCQLVDYLETKIKKPLKDFKNHPVLAQFDSAFTKARADRLLYRVGFTKDQRDYLLVNQRGAFTKFDKIFSYFERAKIQGPQQKVPDGVNLPALYNMRRILTVLPEVYLKMTSGLNSSFMSETEFLKNAISGFAKRQDLVPSSRQAQKIREFQTSYKNLVHLLVKAAKGSSATNLRAILKSISARSQKVNTETRLTGNSLIQIVDLLVQEKRSGMSYADIQQAIDRLVLKASDLPEVQGGHKDSIKSEYRQTEKPAKLAYVETAKSDARTIELARKIQRLLIKHTEDI
jgi:uncharacterized protein YdiU (UPF0061 family)